MNPAQSIISRLKKDIDEVFNLLNQYLIEYDNRLDNQTARGKWTIQEILEHVSLTNHYLLKLIRKGSEKAVRKRNHRDLEKELTEYDFNSPNLGTIADSASFQWESPVRMIPGGASAEEILTSFIDQRESLSEILEKLKNGKGILHKTTMSVYQIGKLDVYQYMHFLLLHARRHINQIMKIRNDFDSLKK